MQRARIDAFMIRKDRHIRVSDAADGRRQLEKITKTNDRNVGIMAMRVEVWEDNRAIERDSSTPDIKQLSHMRAYSFIAAHIEELPLCARLGRR